MSAPMTWQQKLAALKALTSTHLEMRSPGDWYVAAYSREVSVGCMLKGRYGNGETPEAAVDDDWRQIAENPEGKIVINAMSPEKRREVRWNGFMWEDAQ